MAEAVVETCNEGFGSDPADQVVGHELLAGEGTERSVERYDDYIVDSQFRQQGQFLVERRQQAQPFGPAQRDARMRLEGQYDTLAAVGAGFGDQPPDQSPVAQVYAVVRPDGHRRTDELRKRIETVKNPHLSLSRHAFTSCCRRSP